MAALPEIGAMNDPGKWGLPGWKTEQKYDRNVLIGNWYEERRKVSFCTVTDSTHPNTLSLIFLIFPKVS